MQLFLCYAHVLLVVLEELIHSGRLAGSLAGGRQEQSLYVPDIYARAQNEWVCNFYKQNGYLGMWTLFFAV